MYDGQRSAINEGKNLTRSLPRTLAVAVIGALLVPAGAAASAPDSYIVVLKQGTSRSGAVASEHAGTHGAAVKHVYGHALKGYAATIPASRVGDVRADSRVAYVERDGTMSATQTLPWGISKVGASLSSTKAGDGTGAITGVTSYVIDSGIASHRDLNLAGHVNFAGGKTPTATGTAPTSPAQSPRATTRWTSSGSPPAHPRSASRFSAAAAPAPPPA